MRHYHEGAEIYMFGFSRGAYVCLDLYIRRSPEWNYATSILTSSNMFFRRFAFWHRCSITLAYYHLVMKPIFALLGKLSHPGRLAWMRRKNNASKRRRIGSLCEHIVIPFLAQSAVSDSWDCSTLSIVVRPGNHVFDSQHANPEILSHSASI